MADKQPPSEWDRLVMFEALGEEYQRAASALGFPKLSATMGSNSHAREYWLQMMQTMLARKFFASGSAVNLLRIAQALRACAVSGSEKEVEQVAGWTEGQFATRVLDFINPNAFEDVLYGRLLHADWDKYVRSQSLSDEESHLVTYLGSGPVQHGIDMALFNLRVCLENKWIADPTLHQPAA